MRECYLRENPRLGQPLTLLSYAPGPYHLIITPVVELAVLALLTAVTVPRYPFAQSRYFLGDDFEIRGVREPTAKIFRLASLALEPAGR